MTDETQEQEAPSPQPAAEQSAQDRLVALEAALSQAQAETDKARAEAQAHLEDLLRVRAEMDNVRKRAQRDIESAHKYGLEKLVEAFLPVIDSLELGAAAGAQGADPERIREGLELTLKMFAGALEKCGVRPVDPAGEKFNPELHEAIGMDASPEAAPNTVLRVVQRGYLLNERLLRPARVVVARPATA